MSSHTECTERVRICHVQTLADDWHIFRKYTLDYRHPDGVWQRLSREVCSRGDRAVVLLYCPERRSVLLTRQFRLPVFVNGGGEGMLLEAPSGLLDGQASESAIRRETAEEAGVCITHLEKLFSAYMAPTLLAERVHFFVAQFYCETECGSRRGISTEGEDIEILELSLDTAIAMVERAEIVDGKTILLLFYAKANNLLALNVPQKQSSTAGEAAVEIAGS